MHRITIYLGKFGYVWECECGASEACFPEQRNAEASAWEHSDDVFMYQAIEAAQ